MISPLGINKIYSPGIVQQQRKSANVISFKGASDTFEAQAHSLFGTISGFELENILNAADENKKLNSGFTSDIFRYKNTIIKCPKTPPAGTTLPDNEIAKNLKEFFALKEIEKINPDIAVHADDIISRKGVFYLIEDFILGKHPENGNMSEHHLRDIMPKLTELDKNGIVNCDLQKGNIFLLEGGKTKLIDFGSYTFLDNYGNIVSSDCIPGEFFKKDMKIFDFINLPIEQRYAKSLSEHDDFFDIKNLADNPHLNSASNIANFEFRTLYKYLLENNESDSLEFFRNYIKTKGETYHTQMEKFLKTLNIEESVDEYIAPEVIKNTKIKLQKAIHYESLAKEVFEAPSDDVLKTELAKIQLRKFLDPDLYGSSIPGSKKIKSAYEEILTLLHQFIDSADAKEKEYFTETLNCIEKRFKDFKFEPGQVYIPDEENLIKRIFKTALSNAKPEEKIEDAVETVKKSGKKYALAAGGAGIVFAGIIFLKRKNKKTQEAKITPHAENTVTPFRPANSLITNNMPDVFSKTVLKK